MGPSDHKFHLQVTLFDQEFLNILGEMDLFIDEYQQILIGYILCPGTMNLGQIPWVTSQSF